MVYMVRLKRVDWPLGSCVLMSVVMALGQAEYGTLIMSLSLNYSKAECWLLYPVGPCPAFRVSAENNESQVVIARREEIQGQEEER